MSPLCYIIIKCEDYVYVRLNLFRRESRFSLVYEDVRNRVFDVGFHPYEMCCPPGLSQVEAKPHIPQY
jgi:hypothetical protein